MNGACRPFQTDPKTVGDCPDFVVPGEAKWAGPRLRDGSRIGSQSIASGFWRFFSGNSAGLPSRCDSNTATIISTAARPS
jgi:hypothetical protein